LSVKAEAEQLMAWAARARALAPAWREAARRATGAEADLARAMAEEWSSGWPAEVERWAGAHGFELGAPSLDPATAPGLDLEPRWLGLALLAARYFDRSSAALPPGAPAEGAAALELRALHQRACSIEGPRAAAWAQALGRRARAGDVALISRATRAIDTSELWNLGASAVVEPSDTDE
jgi:hypothetical protein